MKAGAVGCLRTILRRFICENLRGCKPFTVGARCYDNVFETLREFRFHLFRLDLLRTDGTFMIIRVWADNAYIKKVLSSYFVV